MLRNFKFWSVLLLIPLVMVPFIIYTKKSGQAEKELVHAVPTKTENLGTAPLKGPLVQLPQASVETPVTIKTDVPNITLAKNTRKSAPEPKHIANPVIVKTDVPSPDTQKTVTPAVKKVKIKNSIEKAMLGYKHWTGRYFPTKFVITFNGVPIENGSSNSVTIDANKKLIVKHEYEFLNGRRAGWRQIEFEVQQSATELDVTFNWLHENHVIIDKAKATKIISNDAKA